MAPGAPIAAIQPLRIAMLSIHSSPLGPLGTQNTGGMSVYVRELAKWLGRWGHHVDIFTYLRSAPPLVELYPKVRLIHLPPESRQEIPKSQLPRHLRAVFRALDAYRRDHGLDYDLIHSHYWLSGVVGALAQACWRRPHLTMFHTLGLVKNHTASGENESDIRIRQERQLVQVADAIVVPAVRELENLVNHYDADPQKIRVIPCGVDLDLFQPLDRRFARQSIKMPADADVILYVGRFAPLKGIDALLGAVADLQEKMPRLHLLVVGGDGPRAGSTRALARLVEELGIRERVTFAGRIDQSALPLYYSACDLVAVPSHYESFGLVVLEALACGAPVAATAVGAVETIIKPGINGIIVDKPDRQSLAQGISRILTESIETRRARRHHVRSTVTHYGWDRMSAAVVQTYGDLCNTHITAQRLPEVAGFISPN